MHKASNLPADMLRPRLLIRAARHGLQDYRRERDLRRLLPFADQSAGHALPSLIEAEAAAEATRSKGDAGYSVSRHIELLIAMLAEAELVGAPSNGCAGPG